MVLFPKRHGRCGKKKQMGLEKLDVLCSHLKVHQLPVKMKCIGVSKSRKGEPMAIYACPFNGCAQREGWVQGRRGTPTRLWRGDHEHHRRRR